MKNYGIDVILKKELKELINMAKEKKDAFNKETINNYYIKYESLLEAEKK